MFNFSSSWKEFAPEPAKLVLRENLKSADAGFFSHVEKVRSRFAHDKNIVTLLSVPSHMNSEREIQWAESRQCLIDALNSFEDKTKKIHVSISHTTLYSIAVACQGDNVSGVGVDIEMQGREISAKAAAKFISSEELSWGLNSLEMWVLKEAAFKSDSSRKAEFVSQYRLLNFDKISGEGCIELTTDKMASLKVKLINQNNLVMGFALA